MDSIENREDGILRLSVEKWHQLALEGTDLPMVTALNGYSMEPLIRYKKDLVTIVPVNRKLLLGDIVLFKKKDGVFVVHRLYRILDDGKNVQTWGDNCYHPDPVIDTASIWGIAVSVEKKGIQHFLDTDHQRQKGLKWIKSKHRRHVWFTYRRTLQRVRDFKNSILRMEKGIV